MTTRQVIAVDLGAASGRVMQVAYDGAGLDLVEAHRFPNVFVTVGGTVYWDVLRLWHDITTGIEGVEGEVAALGIDTWGVDFGLLDHDGNLLGNPVHYRDARTQGMMEWVFERVPQREVFERTGIQFLVFNTLFQLASLAAAGSSQLSNAGTLLMMPDLLNYWLTGEKVSEFTIATTSQCYDPRAGNWDRELLKAAGIPPAIFPPVVPSGTQLGTYNGIPVIAPACHDTGSAVVAVPTTTTDFAYISSGTWSVIGLELQEPVIDDATYTANMSNEGGAEGTFRFLKNMTGLWLAQQCRATWQAVGQDYDYGTLSRLAEEAEPFRSLVDPDDPLFLPPGDMPDRIREYCRRTGQPVPESVSQVMRTVYESLAFKTRVVLDSLLVAAGRTIDSLHIVGGGSQAELLCQMIANTCDRTVVAGPVEATATGNAIVQLITLGEFANVAEARTMLSRMAGLKVYQPENTSRWQAAFEHYCNLIKS